MCFTLKIEDLKITKRQIIAKHIQIATKDIKVYKIVEIWKDKTCRSYFQQFIYTKGFLYTEIRGFSYSQYFDYTIFDKLVGQTFNVHRGFHSYIKISPRGGYIYSPSFAIKAFYIPKGARYFKNDEEYVSDQIVLY